jgi:hypothetical protein
MLRTLWRRRTLVALVAVFAVGVGYLLAFEASFPPKSRSYTVGQARARILVDTPDSQVVEVAPKGTETLGTRASLLANLMVEGEVKASIAARAGLPPKRLIAFSQVGADPAAVSKLEGVSGPNLHSLMTSVVTNPDLVELPMIEVDTQAPTPQEAIVLARASIDGLRGYLSSRAASEQVPDWRRLQVRSLGNPQGSESKRGTGKLTAFGASLFLFLLGCGAILIATALARDWRAASATERGSLGGFTPHAEADGDGLVVDLDQGRLSRIRAAGEGSSRSA